MLIRSDSTFQFRSLLTSCMFKLLNLYGCHVTKCPVLQWTPVHIAVSWQCSTSGVRIAPCVSVLQKVVQGVQCVWFWWTEFSQYMTIFLFTTQTKITKKQQPPFPSSQTFTKYIGIKKWGMQNLRYLIVNSNTTIVELTFFVLLAA